MNLEKMLEEYRKGTEAVPREEKIAQTVRLSGETEGLRKGSVRGERLRCCVPPRGMRWCRDVILWFRKILRRWRCRCLHTG